MEMYRAIIVDDEVTVRRGLRNHFDWSKHNIEIAADFPDGEKAYDYVQNNHVDLIVTDVRMPRMDGIELAKRAHQLNPKIRILFVSGYNDTDYLRKALKIDAVDYILKSIDLIELDETMKRVVYSMDHDAQIDQKIAHLEEKLQQSIPLLQQRSLMLLIGEEFQYDNISKERLIYLDIPLSDVEEYFILVLQIRDVWRVFSEMKEHERLIFSIQLQNEALDILEQYGNRICFENKLGEFVMIINAEQDNFEDVLLTLSEKLQRLVTNNYGMRSNIGISEKFSGFKNAHSSYKNAVRAIQNRYYLDDDNSISVDKFSDSTTLKNIREFANKEVCDALLSGDYSKVCEVTEKLFADAEEISKNEDQQNIMIYMLLLPTKVLSSVKTGEKGSYNNQRKLLERFLYCKELPEQKILILDLYEEVTRIINSRSESQSNHVIEKVKQIISQKYMEQLSIASLAEDVFLTATYLCALFKQSSGQTINEYITEVRINKAKELLADHRIKLYDVCYNVGYYSPSYFSKLFKKNTGMTPSEYREATLN